MSLKFIRLSEVQRRTGYSKAWLYRLMSQKKFPASVKIGSRSIAFIESEMNGLISASLNRVVRWRNGNEKSPCDQAL